MVAKSRDDKNSKPESWSSGTIFTEPPIKPRTDVKVKAVSTGQYGGSSAKGTSDLKLNKNDVFEFCLVLKHKRVKEIIEKKILNRDAKIASTWTPINKQNTNLLTKKIKMYFAVTKSGKKMGYTETISRIAEHLYAEYFSRFFPSDVIFTTAQICKVENTEAHGGRHSIGLFKQGRANVISQGFRPNSVKFGTTSSKAFVFNLSSNVVNGGSDDFTLRFPFVSLAFDNPFVSFGSGQDSTPVLKICKDFIKPIEIPNTATAEGKDNLTLQLAYRTKRKGIDFSFYKVDYVAVNGFVASATKSAIAVQSDTTDLPVLDAPPSLEESIAEEVSFSMSLGSSTETLQLDSFYDDPPEETKEGV